MPSKNALVLFTLTLLPYAVAQEKAPQETDNLPVKRVVLYKNGVGYFEHVGPVRDNQSISIPFTSGQLNDVLKSLTVLDLNGGRITGVAYGSSAPIERQLGDLRIPGGNQTSLSEFLGGLRGARLEIKNGTSVVTGRLLSVERKTRVSGGTTLEVDYLSLITDSGELRTTEVSPGFSVRLLDKELTGKVNRLLDIVASGRQADARNMVVSTEGTGARSLFVSYISEVPVWKSTYRLVLNSKSGAKPLLQGWAIVDNTVGQDWDKVQLSLVAGAPQSFVQNLSQPYYARRPVVGLPEAVTGTPQTYESTLMAGGGVLSGRVMDQVGAVIPGAIVRAFGTNDALVGEVRTGADGAYQFATLPEGTVRLEISCSGFNPVTLSGLSVSSQNPTRRDVRLQVGSVSESISVESTASEVQSSSAAAASSRNTGRGGAMGGGAALPRQFDAGRLVAPKSIPRDIDSLGSLAIQPAAVAQELGDLFEYKLKDPISIAKNRSALVPIVQTEIAAEKVSIWNDRLSGQRPQRALWLTNTSGNTLDGGSFSVMEEETFAGEGIFDPIRPGEKRLVSYATDLALNASSRNTTEAQRVTRVAISRGVMRQTSEIREKKTYTFRNEDSSPRVVVVEHPARPNYELRSEARPDETTAGWMRFRLRVDPKQTASLVVDEARPQERTYAISSIDSQQLQLFVRQQSIDKAVEDALQKVLTQKIAIASLEQQKESRDDEMTKIFDDQQRLRENVKSLKGSAEEKALLQRYTQQLNEQETRLESLRKDIAGLEEQAAALRSALDKTIDGLVLDVKL